eukprot:NODE_94_length_21525_cov_0.751003.p16 type:complete len:146 gc:universal NODE_94_length_21525_cov_0.751003:9965-10402(+)
MEYKLFVGKLKYFFISGNRILRKKFEEAELQDICANLINGYEKDGKIEDLFEELFRNPLKFSIDNSVAVVELEIGEFEILLSSEINIIPKLLDHIVQIENDNYILRMKAEKYEYILRDQNLLSKKYKPESISGFDLNELLDTIDN